MGSHLVLRNGGCVYRDERLKDERPTPACHCITNHGDTNIVTGRNTTRFRQHYPKALRAGRTSNEWEKGATVHGFCYAHYRVKAQGNRGTWTSLSHCSIQSKLDLEVCYLYNRLHCSFLFHQINYPVPRHCI